MRITKPTLSAMLVVLCLFQAGILVSMLMTPEPEPVVQTAPVIRPALEQLTIKLPEADYTLVDLETADEYFISGQPEKALEIYAELNSGTEQHATLLIREALCRESLEQFRMAFDIYQILSSSEHNERFADICHLGQARTRLRMKETQFARAMAGDFLLRNDRNEETKKAFLADASYMWGLSLTAELTEDYSTDLIAHQSIASINTVWPYDYLTNFLNLINTDYPTEENLQNGTPGVFITNRFGPDLDEIQISGTLPTTPVPGLINQCLMVVDSSATWSKLAADAIESRQNQIHIKDESIASVLDKILEPIGLGWSMADSGIVIFKMSELSTSNQTDLRQDIALRSMRQSVVSYPTNGQSPMGYLGIGNILFARGDYLEAIGAYGQLGALFPRSKAQAPAFYNTAKCQSLLHEFDAAKRSFYSVVDSSPEHYLTPLAYYLLGCLYLDDINPKQSAVVLEKSIRIVNSQYMGSVAIALATAYSMQGYNRVSSEVLFKQRPLIAGTQRKVSLFLTYWNVYASEGQPSDIAASNLLEATLQADPKAFPRHTGYLMLSRSYLRLKMSEPAFIISKNALEAGAEPGTPIGDELLYHMAIYYLGIGEGNHAKDILVSLKEGSSNFAANSHLELARLAFKTADYDTCIDLAYELFENEPTEALRILGKVYEKQGDYYRAAFCFAGELPDRREKEIK